MNIKAPFIIGPDLRPALRIGDAYVSMEYAERRQSNGRTRYRYRIYGEPFRKEHVGENLQSGCQGGTLVEGFGSLLAFLDACAEGGENAILFPKSIGQWADDHQSELGMLREEIETNHALIEE